MGPRTQISVAFDSWRGRRTCIGPLVWDIVQLFVNRLPIFRCCVREAADRHRELPWLALDVVRISDAEDPWLLRGVAATRRAVDLGDDEVTGPSAPRVLVMPEHDAIARALFPLAIALLDLFGKRQLHSVGPRGRR